MLSGRLGVFAAQVLTLRVQLLGLLQLFLRGCQPTEDRVEGRRRQFRPERIRRSEVLRFHRLLLDGVFGLSDESAELGVASRRNERGERCNEYCRCDSHCLEPFGSVRW